MRKFLRFMSWQIGNLFSFKTLLSQSIPVFQPFYHTVSDKNLTYIQNYPYRNTKEFEEELDYFLNYFQPISLDDLVTKNYQNKKVLHLSFDDGLKESIEVIVPILLKKGIPATFFVNSGFVDNKALFHRYKASLILSMLNENNNKKVTEFLKNNGIDLGNILQTYIQKTEILNKAAKILEIDYEEFLTREKPYLDVKQILELKKLGFSIGAHSNYHSEFHAISDQEKRKEVVKSMDWLNEYIKPKIKAFSFPFTDSGVSSTFLKKLKTDGICDLTFGTAGLKFDELDFHYQRYPVEQQGDFIRQLKSEFVYFKLRNWMGKNTVKH